MPPSIALLGESLLFLSLIGIAIYFLLKTEQWRFPPLTKGALGEAGVNAILRRLDPDTYRLIPDITLPTPDGTTQIDHVVVSAFGIFVIETKTYTGWIYGRAQDAQWTQFIYRNKQRFQNPLRQNFKHTQTLAELTRLPKELFKSIVVFAGDAEFKTLLPPNVVYLRDLATHIHTGYPRPSIPPPMLPGMVEAIQAWANSVDPELKRQHMTNLRRNHQPVPACPACPACPRCGQPMLLRTARKTHSQFWGCPTYPKCQGTRQASRDSSPAKSDRKLVNSLQDSYGRP